MNYKALIISIIFYCSFSSKGQNIRFAALADFGLPEQGTPAVAALIKSWNPDFIITHGDDDYTDGTFQGLDDAVGQFYHEYVGNYHGVYGQGASVNRFFPVPSDHSFGDDCSKESKIAAYLDFYTLPDSSSPQSFDGELNYWFRKGPVLFFMINSMDCFQPGGSGKNSPLAQWVASVADTSDAPFKLISFHHTPYTSGRYRPGTQLMRWDFEDMGINVVMAGHDHTYERFHLGRVLYFTNGLGGVDMRELNSPRIYGSQASFTGKHGAMLIEANNDSMTFKFFTSDSQLIDSYVLLNGGPPTPPVPKNFGGESLAIDKIKVYWKGDSTIVDRYEIERSKGDTNHFHYVGYVYGNINEYFDTELDVEQQYYYRIHSYNLSGYSGYSPIVAIKTLARPKPPQGVRIDSVSFDAVKLVWNKYNEPGEQIEIQRKKGQSFMSRFYQIATVGILDTFFIDTGLQDSTYYSYRLRIINSIGNSLFSDTVSAFTFKNPTSVKTEGKLSKKFFLEQNYPNPFNPVTVINYRIDSPNGGSVLVDLSVYDLTGKKIVTLVNEKQPPGEYSINFEAEKLTSGVYIYKLSANNNQHKMSRKMVLLR